MKRHHTPAVLAAVLALVLPLAGCARKAEVPAAEVVPVFATKVQKRAVPIEVTAIGNVEALQTVAVQARVAGEIDEVAFREGQDVQPGDLLFTIDPRPYAAALAEAQARLERDRALAKNAEESAARYADLVKKDYVTPEQYEQMRAAVEAARATARADEAAVENARLQLSYAKIVVSHRRADGQHPGAPREHVAAQRRAHARHDQPDAADRGRLHGPRVGLRRHPPGPVGGQAVRRGAALSGPRGSLGARARLFEPADAGRGRRERRRFRRAEKAGNHEPPRPASSPSSTTPSTARPARSA